ncbi:MAG TPA: helix-turn-helix domain-containing protein [Bryobacteraceae bacterium]|nr:helix-turn-helix domain-containing protein [Bryobacteraceae bacterium]
MSDSRGNVAAFPSVSRDGYEGLLTVRQVAAILQVSPAFVHDHASGRRRPVLHRVKLGRLVRFHRSDVDAFVRECEEIVGKTERAA